jgi:hypothetical protein
LGGVSKGMISRADRNFLKGMGWVYLPSKLLGIFPYGRDFKVLWSYLALSISLCVYFILSALTLTATRLKTAHLGESLADSTTFSIISITVLINLLIMLVVILTPYFRATVFRRLVSRYVGIEKELRDIGAVIRYRLELTLGNCLLFVLFCLVILLIELIKDRSLLRMVTYTMSFLLSNTLMHCTRIQFTFFLSCAEDILTVLAKHLRKVFHIKNKCKIFTLVVIYDRLCNMASTVNRLYSFLILATMTYHFLVSVSIIYTVIAKSSTIIAMCSSISWLTIHVYEMFFFVFASASLITKVNIKSIHYI